MTSLPPERALQVTSLHCPNCGGLVQLRGFAHTLSAACQFCGAIIDTSTPAFQIVYTSQSRQAVNPRIPLGARGKLDNIEWEVIGFQIRSTTVDGEEFEWREYVLFNPYRGFRYLTESDGHWNLVRTLARIPEVSGSAVHLDGQLFRLFESGVALTAYVLGEFPWRLQLNESVNYYDYIAESYILSAERSSGDEEVTWSFGRYISADELWNAFHLNGRAPASQSIGANQPPLYKDSSLWGLYVLSVVVLLCLMIVCTFLLPGDTVFKDTYEFAPRAENEPAFVTPPFTISGHTTNVEMNVSTDLSNSWAYINFALINTKDGHAYNFGHEISYYQGSDSDGSWSEGATYGSVKVPAIPPGEYYLRIEPEMDKAANVMHYAIEVRRGVVSWSWFWLAACLLAVPPIFVSWRRAAFERGRWERSNRSLSTLGDLA